MRKSLIIISNAQEQVGSRHMQTSVRVCVCVRSGVHVYACACVCVCVTKLPISLRHF